MNLMDMILNGQNGELVRQMANNFQLDEGQARSAMGALVPALSRGIGREASSPQGLEDLVGALGRGNHRQYVDEPASLGREGAVVEGNGILGHLFGSKEVSREEKLYRLQLHRPPVVDIDRAKTKRTLLAPLGLVVYGVVMPFLTLNFYVIPYQVGTGEILADGSVNWDTPEALITLTTFLLHVPLALMANNTSPGCSRAAI